MSWEFIGAYFATKALDAAWMKFSPSTRAIFVEKAERWLAPTLAERYLLLDGEALFSFYRNESPIQITFADQAFVLPAVLAHEPVGEGRLAEQPLAFAVSSKPFTVSNALDSFVQPVRVSAESDARLFNGRVVRLADLSSSNGAVCPAHYYDALATNFAMDHKPSGRTESLREILYAAAGALGPLRGNALVNHIGLVCILETSDGMLVAQRRSAQVANRAHTISASVSGALNWMDIWRIEDGMQLPLSGLVAGAIRESLEELGTEPDQLRYLGIVREYLRGGKPEVYFYGRTSASLGELTTARRNAEGRKESKSLEGFEFQSERVSNDAESRNAFQERVRGTLEQCGDTANFTFVAGVLLTGAHVLRITA